MKRIITTVLIAIAIYTGLTVSSCSSPDTGGVEQFFAKVDIPLITSAEGTESLLYTNYLITSMWDSEQNVHHYEIYPNFKWSISFLDSEKDGSNGIRVFSQRYDSEDYGLGTINDGRLVLRNAERIYDSNKNGFVETVSFTYSPNIQADELYGVRDNASVRLDTTIDNFAWLCNINKSDWDGTVSSFEEYIEEELYEKIDAATPETVYESSDGMVIKIKLFKTDCPFDGVKAIVSGTIENPTNDFKRQYEEEYGEWIYSVMTDGDYFRSGMTAEGETYIGPRIHWSPSKLIVEGNKEKEIPEIVLTRKK